MSWSQDPWLWHRSSHESARKPKANLADGPTNLYEIISMAAEDDSRQGIRVHLFPGLERDVTQFSKYDGALEYDDIGHFPGGTYPRGFILYKVLFRRAKSESCIIEELLFQSNTKVVLIHTDNDLDAIHWFWAVVCAGGIPCPIGKLNDDPEQRKKQILSLNDTLEGPLIVTSTNLKPLYEGAEVLKLLSFAEIEKARVEFKENINNSAKELDKDEFRLSLQHKGYSKRPEEVAALVLTSGSTGDSKAVCLTSRQMIASIKGKSECLNTTYHDVFLNWTSFDHVANLMEIHLHAMFLGCYQITIPAAMMISNPLLFLSVIDTKRVTYAFAPSFFIGMLLAKIPSMKEEVRMNANLSCLKNLMSGGEPNPVDSLINLTNELCKMGTRKCFIRPGFGMSETCAGSIYNAWDCPVYDEQQNTQFANLGACIPGMQMRIVGNGELQLKGPALFEKYYNNVRATFDAFTEDGWFKTGDMGYLDDDGRLHLTGRSKDLIIINGANHQPHGIEGAIEDATILGVTPTFTAAFGVRVPHSNTESLIIVYLPDGDAKDINGSAIRVATGTEISKAVVKFCGVRPYKVIPLDETVLVKSSLGKLSRSKLMKLFSEGGLDQFIKVADAASDQVALDKYESARTSFEVTILQAFNARFGDTNRAIGVKDDIFALGVSSLDILGLKVSLQETFQLADLPITMFFNNPVISDLAVAIEKMQGNIVNNNIQMLTLSPKQKEVSNKRLSMATLSDPNLKAYNPMVVLNPHDTGLPIFFIHPGVGEILIFMNIARHFKDRPVYGLRARGFNGEPFFSSFNEIYSTYTTAIRKVQPTGPYHFVGYSFGSVVAFEITKYLQYIGQEVRFLAFIDQIPHFKARAKSYDWYECVITLAFFHGLMPEKYAYSILPKMRLLPHEAVLDHIFTLATPQRLKELAMTREKLNNWAHLALGLKKNVADWDPTGKVRHVDVFYTEPLVGLVKAKDTKDWLENYIAKWSDFTEEGGARYWQVGGTHRTLISPPNLASFWKTFSKAMAARGC